MPTSAYSMHLPARLVKINRPPVTSNAILHTPVTAPVKYKIPDTMAAIILILRSVFPIFFFIEQFYCVRETNE